MKKLSLEYQILTKTYLKPTYLPTYATLVTEVTVVTVADRHKVHRQMGQNSKTKYVTQLTNSKHETQKLKM